MKGVDESRINSIGQYLFFFSESVSTIDGYRQTVGLAWEENKMGFTIRIYIVIDRDEQFEYIINSVYDRIGWLIFII